jgi:hypothetical protein
MSSSHPVSVRTPGIISPSPTAPRMVAATSLKDGGSCGRCTTRAPGGFADVFGGRWCTLPIIPPGRAFRNSRTAAGSAP